MTIQAVPATIFNDLMERAILLLRSGSSSELEMKRLERDIDKLASVDPSGAFELRGRVAAIRGDLESTMEMYKRALMTADDYRGTVVRYLIALADLGQTEMIKSVFDEHRDALRSDPAAMRTVETLLAYAGWLDTANQVTDEMERMGLKSEARAGEGGPIDNRGFTEADLAQVVGFSHRFLISHGARATGTQSVTIPYEGEPGGLLFQLEVNKGPEAVAELEWELFGALEEADLPAEKQGFLQMVLKSGVADVDVHQHS